MIRLVPLTPERHRVWDEFVARADNGHYFACRAFLDYHGGRFADRSVFVHRDDRIVAVIPLHRSADGRSWCSHRGAPWGGVLQVDRTHSADIAEALDRLAEAIRADGAEALELTPVPAFLHRRRPCDEDGYLLQERGATRCALRAGAAVRIGAQLVSTSSRRQQRRAQADGIRVRHDFPLAEALAHHAATVAPLYGRPPLHSEAELLDLAARAPGSWQARAAERRGELLASEIFLRHSPLLRQHYSGYRDDEPGSLGQAALAADLLGDPANQGLWLDIGTSNALADGRLHPGIQRYKESLGARLYALSTWRWSLA